MMAQKIKVSVSIITYNQAEYIRKAVDSALAQEVDFRYEIIIGDDCSTDGTREIIMDYKQKYPDLIKLNLQDKHDEEGIAGRKNNITNIKSAKGKYIAFLDGDDWWISKDKLLQQAEFMDANPKYSFCFHDAFFTDVNAEYDYLMSEKFISLRKSKTFTFKDFVGQKVEIPACSTFFRTHFFHPLPAWFRDVYLADRFLQMIAAQHGPIRYMKNLKSARFLHAGSISKQYLGDKMLHKVRENDFIIHKTNFDQKIGRPINYDAQCYLQAAKNYFSKKKYNSSVFALVKAVLKDWRVIPLHLRRKISELRFKFIRASD